MTGAQPPVRHLGVLVPARDEEQLLGPCLAALAVAAAVVTARRPDVAVSVVVVLDGCRDGSAREVRRAPWPSHLPRPHLLETGAAGVGAARRAGAARLLAAAEGTAATTWLAGTDADSTVPAGWLDAQLEAADLGFHARVGTVVLPPRDRLAARWGDLQRHVEGHTHVHGANLGVRGDAYLRAGGYPPLRTGEDVALVQALDEAGARVLRTARGPVLTSARRTGRAPDGVAADLAELAADVRAS